MKNILSVLLMLLCAQTNTTAGPVVGLPGSGLLTYDQMSHSLSCPQDWHWCSMKKMDLSAVISPDIRATMLNMDAEDGGTISVDIPITYTANQYSGMFRNKAWVLRAPIELDAPISKALAERLHRQDARLFIEQGSYPYTIRGRMLHVSGVKVSAMESLQIVKGENGRQIYRLKSRNGALEFDGSKEKMIADMQQELDALKSAHSISDAGSTTLEGRHFIALHLTKDGRADGTFFIGIEPETPGNPQSIFVTSDAAHLYCTGTCGQCSLVNKQSASSPAYDCSCNGAFGAPYCTLHSTVWVSQFDPTHHYAFIISNTDDDSDPGTTTTGCCSPNAISIALGGGVLMPSKDVRDKAFIENGSAFGASVNIPLKAWTSGRTGSGLSVSAIITGDYFSSGKQPNTDAWQQSYKVMNSTTGVSYKGTGSPKSQGFKVGAGPQLNVHIGSVTVSPSITAGYESLTSKAFELNKEVSYNGTPTIYTLFSQTETKTSGLVIMPALKVMYCFGRFGIWADAGYNAGPTIKNETLTLKPSGTANEAGEWEGEQLKAGSWEKNTGSTALKAITVRAGVSMSIRRSELVGHVTLLK